MLEKINYIKNIGKFYDVSIKGTPSVDPSFKEFNLIFADNGTGKSTLSTILKSLWRNDPQRLIERKTIGSNSESEINIQIKGKSYIFKDEKWNKAPEVAMDIFDEEFVAKNVFSPNGVDAENRRELFNYIVLGEENVSKTNEVEKLNCWIRSDLKSKIENAEGNLKKAANIQDIKILDEAQELDDNTLTAMRNRVEENNKMIIHAERIKNEKKLECIDDFKNISFAGVISKDLGSLSFAAEYKTHVQKHNEWIKDGMEIVSSKESGESCPFCFQEIKNNKAIETYRTLFSEEYETLRKQVLDQIVSIDNIYSDAAVKNIISVINRNSEKCDFWYKLDNNIPTSLSLDIALEEAVSDFKQNLKNLLERKKNNLLEKISPNDTESNGISQEDKFRESISKYNTIVIDINNRIQAVKNSSSDIEELKIENNNNHITVVCNDVGYKNEETSKIYKDLEGMRQQKRDAEIKIKNLREEIDQASRDILENYQESINKELKNFGVEFSINGVKRKSDNSRKEGVDFNIFLKGESFNPRGSGDSPYKISNTLSAGDKSTLAFAFFVAKHQGKDISNQILIFDDPITSLDFFRKTQTKNKILKLQEHGAQVIVLTHSNEFAKLFDKIKEGSTTKRFIKIQKNNIYSGLSCTLYNKLSDMIISKHDRYRNLISRYIVDPSSVDRSEVMTSIRPYVETEIKQCMVDIRETSLGKMIERLRNENISEEFIENLEHINEVSTPVHHGSAKKRANDYEHITDDELNNLCKNAININYNPLQPLTRDFVNSQNQTP